MIRAALLLALFAGNASAAGISLCELCTGYTLTKRSDGSVLVRCPGQVKPLFTLQNCRNPVVTRNGANVTITCR